MSIILGVSLLVSHTLLWYGGSHGRRDILTTFFILTIPVLLLYWVWFAYLKYGLQDTGEASKEVWLYSSIAKTSHTMFQVADIGTILSIIFVIIIIPVIFLNRALGKHSLEQEQQQKVSV